MASAFEATSPRTTAAAEACRAAKVFARPAPCFSVRPLSSRGAALRARDIAEQEAAATGWSSPTTKRCWRFAELARAYADEVDF